MLWGVALCHGCRRSTQESAGGIGSTGMGGLKNGVGVASDGTPPGAVNPDEYELQVGGPVAVEASG